MMKPTLLVSPGDAKSPVTWSGTPFHFFEIAQRVGLVTDALATTPDTRAIRLNRWLWNARQALLLQGVGGYGWSNEYLEALWEPIQRQVAGSRVLSTTPLHASSVVRNPTIERWYYIDATVRQSMDYYGARAGRGIRRDALSREQEGYHGSGGVMTLSRFAAQSVIDDYGMPPERVRVITPGANISAPVYERWVEQRESAPPGRDAADVRFVMVGKFWHRKGLDRLLAGLRLALRQGARATLRVVGCAREDLPRELRDTPNVEWVGFINKAKDLSRWLEVVTACDVGVLLSRADFSPIAIREYWALGLAVLAARTGGIPEMVNPDGAWLVEPSASDDEIAHAILTLCQDRDRLWAMRDAAWNTRAQANWRRSVAAMVEFMPVTPGA